MKQTIGTYKINPELGDYVYNQGQWLDLNGDGIIDYITVKYRYKDDDSQLVWLERP